MLFQELGKMKRSWIMTSIILGAVGLVMIMCPVRYMGMLISGAGYALLVTAVVMILEFLSSKKVLINYVLLTGAILIGLLGMLVLIDRGDVLPMMSLLFGLGLIIEGLSDLFNAFMYTRRAGKSAWRILAVLSLLTILVGLILLMYRWHSPVVLKRVIGGMMLFSSLINIIRVILAWPFKSM